MSEEQGQPGQQPNPSERTPDLIDELRKFGQQIETLFSTAMQSERAKTIQQDIANGMREIGTRVQESVRTVQDNPKIQELEERGRQALKEARESQVLDKFQDTLVQGLNQLNREVGKLVEKLKSDQPPPPAPAQSVPIDEDEGPKA